MSPTRNDPGDGARAPRAERRSSTRPVFHTGWRKALDRKFVAHEPHPAPSVDVSAHVDVWMANPDALIAAQSSLTVLSADDWAAINAVRDQTARRSTIAARVLLRIGLSHAGGHAVPPAEWRFSATPRGKPVVAGGLPQIHFSVSHADQFVAVAISSALEIGIDIECVDQNIDRKMIADFCHIDEVHSVGGLPRPQEIREFVRLWTLKEAYAKLIGAGHTLDFKAIQFTLDPVSLTTAEDRVVADAAQFETFYVSEKHVLFHVSLAMRSRSALGTTEIQVITLRSTERKDAVHAAASDQRR